ncbi:hypothetical protein VTI74DRAFT_5366 [Chaetomium olivicolor]
MSSRSGHDETRFSPPHGKAGVPDGELSGSRLALPTLSPLDFLLFFSSRVSHLSSCTPADRLAQRGQLQQPGHFRGPCGSHPRRRCLHVRSLHTPLILSLGCAWLDRASTGNFAAPLRSASLAQQHVGLQSPYLVSMARVCSAYRVPEHWDLVRFQAGVSGEKASCQMLCSVPKTLA